MRLKKLFNKIKEYKDPILMITSTVLEIGAVLWAFRAGAQAKEALEDLPEDSTAKDRVAAAGPYMIGPMVSVGIGEFLKWYCHKNALDRLGEVALVAAATAVRADNKDAAVKEVVTKEQYEEIEKRTAVKNLNTNGIPKSDLVDTGTGDTIFVFDLNGQAIIASKDWLESRFYTAMNDANSDKCGLTINDLAGYFKMPGNIYAHDDTGWPAGGMPDRLIFSHPDGDPTTDKRFDGKPYVIFKCNVEPRLLNKYDGMGKIERRAY